ncbi:uncharacterized protein KY384_001267 [Bacidia gigantensis]|uniref:uncharacterized protein n=1 Tax=Bacidia gigantensis TaxID=2732470 RepID=UPI001D03A3D9|nr:uncharacterized protein KY384_001267 [Bacidia gigantensis]KAG8533527.1 hypothetical protein KY384_001267 [Bacidia gigantensis]
MALAAPPELLDVISGRSLDTPLYTLHAASTFTADPTMAPAAVPTNLLIPLKLDAFVFNEQVCNGNQTQAKIAPIAQPNYTFLRISDFLAQNDIFEHVDLHNATPPELNARLMDLGTGKVREERIGVYLHWIVPRPYRGGSAATSSFKGSQSKTSAGRFRVDDPMPGKEPQPEASAPTFPPTPNRWLIIRRLDPNADTTKPKGAPIESVKAWIVESDRVRKVDELSQFATNDGADKVDLQVDVSPFVTSSLQKLEDAPNLSLDAQAEIFIGICQDAQGWQERGKQVDRAGLTVTSSSNQLFPDFQHHCSNVFSMRDTFQYTQAGKIEKLSSANASYFVLGWHDDEAQDPFSGGLHGSRADRMKDRNVVLFNKQPYPTEVEEWLKSPNDTRVLCHGAMYDVRWTRDNKPDTVPADKASDMLNNKMSVSVGTTPLDSMLTYARAHDHPENSVADDILRLQTLLRAQDEGLGGHIAATGEIQSYNFGHFEGGVRFHLSKDDDTPVELMDTDFNLQILKLNAVQTLYDSILRRATQLRWDLFAVWWKYISDTDNRGGGRNSEYAAAVTTIVSQLNTLDNATSGWKGWIDQYPKNNPGLNVKAGAAEEFHQQKDPTLLIAGVKPGWPRDYQDSLKVRLDSQTVQGKVFDIGDEYGLQCLPKDLIESAKALTAEFLNLATHTTPETPPDNAFFPLYHDGEREMPDRDEPNPWRDRWNATQSWFPLYMEWEAEYIHIPFENWNMIALDSSPATTQSKVAFALSNDITNKGFHQEDTRIVSGRSLILPQPNFSLKAQLDVLFSSVSKDRLDALLPETDRTYLYDHLDQLAFLSSPLAGFTEHLLTLFRGNHVKPLVRIPGRHPVALKEAEQAAANIGLIQQRLSMIDKESDPTPYGPNSSLLDNAYTAFKPVTHGQMRFTKVNIIDKFGQVIHAIDPRYGPTIPPLYPTVGEYYQPRPISDKDSTPNVADPSRTFEGKMSEFIQLPPYINQPARLNAEFVVRNPNSSSPYWVPANDWDRPIWGWIIVNYVDMGLQLFLPDGTFYREVRVSEGSSGGTAWLPFKPPKKPTTPTQLDSLLNKLLEPDQKYLLAFMDMVSRAMESLPTPTSAYAQFASSLIGRPLALVNMGWSLELSTKPKTIQSTLESQRHSLPDRSLLPGGSSKYYQWPLKLGDVDMLTDGLVGYFASSDSPTPSNELDLTKIYTYPRRTEQPNARSPSPPLVPLDQDTYPKMTAFWLDPNDSGAKYLDSIEAGSAKYDEQRQSKMQVFGAIMDPFLPVTGYSSILPIRSLKLPTYMWETALQKITNFFHAGPLLVPANVPPFNNDYKLVDEYILEKIVPGSAVEMPALAAADWTWLQPYEEGIMPLAVGRAEVKPGFQQGPYLATEGYLQMKSPITHEKPPYE